MSSRPVAVVSGASVGIGQAIAVKLSDLGYDLVLSSLPGDSLDATEKMVSERGSSFFSCYSDLSNVKSIHELFIKAKREFGSLSVLVNNAAAPLHKPALTVTEKEWDFVVDVNLRGTFFMCQEMGRHLKNESRPGRIVNISSTHGLVALNGRSTYGITKAGIIHMTRMLAIEWADLGIRVNAVAPATISTPSREAVFASSGTRDMMVGRIPLKRFGTSEEVACAVGYLVSIEADFLTGQTIVLDGGLTSI